MSVSEFGRFSNGNFKAKIASVTQRKRAIQFDNWDDMVSEVELWNRDHTHAQSSLFSATSCSLGNFTPQVGRRRDRQALAGDVPLTDLVSGRCWVKGAWRRISLLFRRRQQVFNTSEHFLAGFGVGRRYQEISLRCLLATTDGIDCLI